MVCVNIDTSAECDRGLEEEGGGRGDCAPVWLVGGGNVVVVIISVIFIVLW